MTSELVLPDPVDPEPPGGALPSPDTSMDLTSYYLGDVLPTPEFTPYMVSVPYMGGSPLSPDMVLVLPVSSLESILSSTILSTVPIIPPCPVL